jgi:classical protein kinase C
LRQNDAKVREAERSLSYFEDTLRELQARKLQRDDPSRSGTATSPHQQLFKPGRSSDRDRSLPRIPPFDQDSTRAASSSATLIPGDDTDGIPKAKQYTNLDLIKADTPLTTPKISRMLHQLEFKVQVEMQYKKGIDKMSKLYQADGDKKSRADAESKRVESEKKIQLLQSALKCYKNLHILDDVEEEEQPAGQFSFFCHSIHIISNFWG